MPKYYCDYCDTYLTHDSPSVRKTHCQGRKHKENVRDYYQKWMEEQAQKLVQKQVWLLDADFRRLAGNASPISLLGFKLFNDGEAIGSIEEVIEQPHQILCSIIYNGKEALIPIHEDSLEKVDIKNRKVFVTLPDGLLEIYK